MRYLYRLSILSCLLPTLLLAGCSSKTPKTNYYSLKNNTPQVDMRADQPLKVAVAVGPVRLPQQLNRPQLVTRSDSFQVNIADYERWSGDLQEEVSYALSSHLSRLLGTDKIIISPWPKSFTPEWQIMVDIQRFDGELGKAAYLEARWALTRKKDDLILTGFGRYQEEIDEAGYEALVAAQSRLLVTFSHEIADNIRKHQ